MNIIVDTNVIVAALIQRGIVRELILRRPGVFMTPDACVREVWENRDDWNRKKVPETLVIRRSEPSEFGSTGAVHDLFTELGESEASSRGLRKYFLFLDSPKNPEGQIDWNR